MFKIALCDDNKEFLDKLKELITSIFQKTQHEISLDVFTNGRNLIESIESQKTIYNMIFLDIQMPVINGFRVAERLRQFDENFILLFTTNMQACVKKGYNYNAFRYIFKDYLQEEVSEAIHSILKKHDRKTNNQKMIELKYNNGQVYETLQVPKSDIILLSKRGRTAHMTTIYRDYTLLKYNLEKYKAIIDCDSFIIVSRSYLINMEHIEEIKGDYFILTNSMSISIGSTPSKINEFKLAYGKYRKEMI